MTSKLYLLTSTALLDRWRWARQHLYALLILGPLVLGMTYLTLTQAASYDLAIGPLALSTQVTLGLAFVLSTMALTLSRASRELYHLRQPSAFTDALPIAHTTHLHFALIKRAGHALLLALMLVVARSVSDDAQITASSLFTLALFSMLMTLSESYAALNWIHWGHRRHKRVAAPVIALLGLAALIDGLLLVIFFNPSAATMFDEFFAAQAFARASYFIYAAGLLLALVIYLLTRVAHERWRAEDIDYAQRLEQRAGSNFDATRFLRGRLTESVRAMLARDLYLTVRIFSSAVYVAAGITVSIILLLVALLRSGALPSAEEALGGLSDFGWASATWLPSSLAVKIATVAVVAAMSSIVPVLVSHQEPHTWLERASGATGEELWQAKLWYARLLTLPSALVVFVLGVAAAGVGTGGVSLPLSYLAALFAECLWLWWIASTVVGSLAYEMPDRPELALVLSLGVCLSVGVLGAILWPMGVGIYGLSVAQARERGIMQAAHYLKLEGE